MQKNVPVLLVFVLIMQIGIAFNALGQSIGGFQVCQSPQIYPLKIY